MATHGQRLWGTGASSQSLPSSGSWEPPWHCTVGLEITSATLAFVRPWDIPTKLHDNLGLMVFVSYRNTSTRG